MGNALRGLVFVILALSIAALVFANLLFGKRELLMQRNYALEESIVKLAKTIEMKNAEEQTAPELKQDVSAVEDRVLDNPETDSPLEGYALQLESENQPTFEIGDNDSRSQLRTFYKVGTDGKYVLDSLTQKPSTTGEGTMAELLDKVFDRAKAQQANLNKTRGELHKMRDRFTTAVEEINKLKIDGRLVKKDLTERKADIVRLNDEKEVLEGRIAKLNNEKKELTAELAETKNEVEKLNEDKLTLTDDLANAQKTIEEMKKRLNGTNDRPGQYVDGAVAAAQMTAGDKGKIISANDEMKFCIIEFSPAAIAEMMGPERENPLPQLEMSIRRAGRQSASGEFVTRIKLRQAVRGKNIVVADILNDWQQTAVEKGDVVFF